MGWSCVKDFSFEWNGFAKAKDRKDFLDNEWNNTKVLDSKSHFEVAKSSMVGSTYYAAIKRVNPEGRVEKVFALITMTSKCGNELSFKEMDETQGPYLFDCPKSILKLLTPTDNEYALKWRKGCERRQRTKQLLNEAARNDYEISVGDRDLLYSNTYKKWLRKDNPRYYVPKSTILNSSFIIVA